MTSNTKAQSNARHAAGATYLSDLQLAARYNVHRATIWRWPDSRDFPRPVKFSPGCTRWRLADVEAWETRLEGGHGS